MWTILIAACTEWKMYTFIAFNLIICLRRIFFWHLTKTKLNIWSTKRSARLWMQQVKSKVVYSLLLNSFRKDQAACFCQDLSYVTNRGSQTTATFHLFFVAYWPRLKQRCLFNDFPKLDKFDRRWFSCKAVSSILSWTLLCIGFVSAPGIRVDDLIMQLVGLRYTEADMTVSYPGFLYLLMKMESMIRKCGSCGRQWDRVTIMDYTFVFT